MAPATGSGGTGVAGRDDELVDEEMFRLVVGYRVTQVLHVAATLGVPDRLADRPKDAAVLAREVGARPDALYRVLRTLAAVGVLAMDGSKRFSLTPLGRLLRSDGAHSFAAFAAFNGEQCYPAWGHLLHAVKAGETPFDHVFGEPHFQYLSRNPEASATFNAAMASSSRVAGNPFRGYDFARHRVVVDVGGGRGALIAGILRENPHLRGILFDLPAAVAEAPAHLAPLGVADRCEIQTGSAFEAIPPGGDVYVMSRLLHDFPDERAALLLRNCRRAMPPDGVLLIREGVLPDGPIPLDRALLDLQMLVMNGGRERTAAEWRDLLNRAGFSLDRVLPGAHNQDLLEARPSGTRGGRRTTPSGF